MMNNALCRASVVLTCAVACGAPAQAAPQAAPPPPLDWLSVADAETIEGPRLVGDAVKVIGWCDEGGWIRFGPFDFDKLGVDRIEVQAATPNRRRRVSVHLDGPDGDRVGVLRLTPTGDFNTFRIQQTSLVQVTGTHRICLVFGGGNAAGNVQALRFLRPTDESPNALVHDPAKEADAEDVSIEAHVAQVLAHTREDIARHRMGAITVRTRPGAAVKVTQTSHEFWFGTAIARTLFRPDAPAADRERYLAVLKESFNSVVHENAMKWYSTGAAKDGEDYADVDAMLDWCEANGLRTRGHCVYWAVPKYVQGWIKELSDDELRRHLGRRAANLLGRYRGRVPEYDVNNEMIHGAYYQKRLGPGIRPAMFRWCRAADPDAILYVNDYGILNGGALEKYVDHIRNLLDQGVPIGGIGVQGHFGGRVEARKITRVLDRLGEFGVPIKVTELDLNTTDEALKAKSLAMVYATCFAHPAVNGVLMWGFWEGRHWRPKAALWKKDWTPTPAAEVYTRLVRDAWWTRWEGTADAAGVCRVPAYFGEHTVEVDGKAASVTLTKAAGELRVRQ